MNRGNHLKQQFLDGGRALGCADAVERYRSRQF